MVPMNNQGGFPFHFGCNDGPSIKKEEDFFHNLEQNMIIPRNQDNLEQNSISSGTVTDLSSEETILLSHVLKIIKGNNPQPPLAMKNERDNHMFCEERFRNSLQTVASEKSDKIEEYTNIRKRSSDFEAPDRKRVKIDTKIESQRGNTGLHFTVPNITLPPSVSLQYNDFPPHQRPSPVPPPTRTSYYPSLPISCLATSSSALSPSSMPSNEFVPSDKLRSLYESALTSNGRTRVILPPRKKKRTRRRKARRKPPADSGRKDKRQQMHCAHCNSHFWAKPTERDGRFVLNHKCAGVPRRQYVVGGWHRKCSLNHYAPCIDFVFEMDNLNNDAPSEEDSTQDSSRT